MTGQLYETMVVAEVLKWLRTSQSETDPYFYRTRSGLETDLLLDTSAGLIGIEIKARSTLTAKDLRPLQAIAGKLGSHWRGGIILYTGNRITRLDSPDIWAVPSGRLFQP
jgi:hypothetical protein